MATGTLLRLQQSTFHQPQPFINALTDIVYPVLIERANQLLLSADDINNALYRQLSNHLVAEISAMFTEEMDVLFPLIDTCKPGETLSCDHFKTTKAHYKNLLSACSEMKVVLYGEARPVNVSEELIVFEELLILFQSTKNKYLFAQFKNCKNCRLTEALAVEHA